MRASRHAGFQVGALLLVLFAGTALVSLIWTPHPIDQLQMRAKLLPSSSTYLLGTDHLGRDVLSRIMVGAQTSIAVGLIADYEQAALAAIAAAADADRLEAARVEFLGQKKGRLKDLQKLLGSVSPEERPAIGKRFNEAKSRVSQALDARRAELERPAEHLAGIDVTLPGTPLRLGKRHPLMQTMATATELAGSLDCDPTSATCAPERSANVAAGESAPKEAGVDGRCTGWLPAASRPMSRKPRVATKRRACSMVRPESFSTVQSLALHSIAIGPGRRSSADSTR